MNFIDKAAAFLERPRIEQMRFPEYRAMKRTLTYLVQNAMGRKRAVPVKAVVKSVTGTASREAIEDWRERVLKPLQERIVFVGECEQGLFLILTREDARAAEEFMENQMSALARRLAIFRTQAEYAGLLE